MKTFTFNTPSQQVINTRQQARNAAKVVQKILGLHCTGADKKRVSAKTGKGYWSFDIIVNSDMVKQRAKPKKCFNVVKGCAVSVRLVAA